MTRLIALALAVATGFWILLAAPAPAQPQEDEPGWDCTSMGNLFCGPAHHEAPPGPGLDGIWHFTLV